MELSESLDIALYIIGAGLSEHNKVHLALDAGFDEEDFELGDFVHEKMSGSADVKSGPTGEKFKTPVRPKKKPTSMASMASRMTAVKEESSATPSSSVKKTSVKTPAKV